MGKGNIVIVGIDTEVGKTVVSAIFVEALKADYFKPIQAGDAEFGDKDRVKSWISNESSTVYPNSYLLNSPMSPHAAAKIDGLEINTKKIIRPSTENTLVVEGAGGLMVPLNDTENIIDLIEKDDQVVLVSKNYLGSINHTLLSMEALSQRNLQLKAVVFNGESNYETESIIEKRAPKETEFLRVQHGTEVDASFVKSEADRLRTEILKCLGL